MLTRFAFTPRFDTFFREFDDLFVPPAKEDTIRPAADVRETEKAVELRLDMPGVNPEAIDVKLEGKTLTIRAERNEEKTTDDKGWIRRERATASFFRSFALDDSLTGSEPQASFKHGVLTVSIPKREETQPKSFKVKVEA